MKNKIALITGATSGIGEATAIRLAKEGFDVILTGRREHQVEKIAQWIREKFKVGALPLCFDVRNQEEVKNAIDSLPSSWRPIDVLINNAGLAVGTSALQEGIIDDWERMIDTNIKGLLYVTRAVSPMMIENKNGRTA